MRPKLPPERVKTAKVCVALEAATYDRLYAEAQARAETVPDVIRRRLRGSSENTKPHERTAGSIL